MTYYSVTTIEETELGTPCSHLKSRDTDFDHVVAEYHRQVHKMEQGKADHLGNLIVRVSMHAEDRERW